MVNACRAQILLRYRPVHMLMYRIPPFVSLTCEPASASHPKGTHCVAHLWHPASVIKYGGNCCTGGLSREVVI
jgi:hypothetical protein